MCNLKGYTESRTDYVTQPARQEVQVNSSALPKDVLEFLCDRYSLEPGTIHEEGCTWWDERGRVLSPIYDPAGRRYGYAARAMVTGFVGPKSLNVIQDTAWSGGAFTRTARDSKVIVLVEDVFSAYAVSEYGLRGCALLGVHVSQDMENYLVQFDEIVVALDADATNRAASVMQQLAYLNVRQIPLDKDIKDMTLLERSSVLNY
jgi:DNA primase